MIMNSIIREESNSVKLFELVRKANTDKDEAFKLGVMYLNGNNVYQDTQRALFYFKQASELGHLGVEAIYAYLYKCGAPNFEPNLLAAAGYFEYVGLCIGDENPGTEENFLWEAINLWLYAGEGETPLDEKRGVELLEIMCEKEIPYAMFLMGEAYAKGLWGKTKDEDVANEWYHKSAELGCVAANVVLSDLPF